MLTITKVLLNLTEEEYNLLLRLVIHETSVNPASCIQKATHKALHIDTRIGLFLVCRLDIPEENQHQLAKMVSVSFVSYFLSQKIPLDIFRN